jgi:tetratricopeptide (TPR) repeat protein
MPQDVIALSNRGYCMRKLHRMEEAVQDYSTAIRASPPSLRLFNNRAYCLAKLGRYEEAVADYTAVLCIEPRDAHALQNRYVSRGFGLVAGLVHKVAFRV